jgi:hypothetical protein
VERLAAALGLASILVAAVIGWFAYTLSQKRLLENCEQDVLGDARALVGSLKTHGIETLDPQALANIEAQFASQEQAWPGSYLCVIDESGILRLDTADSGMVGQCVGQAPFVGRDD